jgi:hypothetical protein
MQFGFRLAAVDTKSGQRIRVFMPQKIVIASSRNC